MGNTGIRIALFGVGTILIFLLSLRSLKNPRNHGFYRFFAWEIILWMFIANVTSWFDHPFSLTQILSWILLTASVYPVVDAVYRFRTAGRIDRSRNDPSLISIESTTKLITSGIFRHIRHPMYASLLYLTWGIACKKPTAIILGLALLTSLLLLLTALAEERENLSYFGEPYREYMKRSKRFIPCLF